MKRKNMCDEEKMDKRVKLTLPPTEDPYEDLPADVPEMGKQTLQSLARQYTQLTQTQRGILFSSKQRETGAAAHHIPTFLIPYRWNGNIDQSRIEKLWHVACIYFIINGITAHEGDVIYFYLTERVHPFTFILYNNKLAKCGDAFEFTLPVELCWPKFPLDYWRQIDIDIGGMHCDAWINFNGCKWRQPCQYMLGDDINSLCSNEPEKGYLLCETHADLSCLTDNAYWEFKCGDRVIRLTNAPTDAHHIGLLPIVLTQPNAEPVPVAMAFSDPNAFTLIVRDTDRERHSLWLKTFSALFQVPPITPYPDVHLELVPTINGGVRLSSTPMPAPSLPQLFAPDGKFDEYILPEDLLCKLTPDGENLHLDLLINTAKARRENRKIVASVLNPMLLMMPTTLIAMISEYVY